MNNPHKSKLQSSVYGVVSMLGTMMLVVLLNSCTTSSGEAVMAPPTPTLPVIAVTNMPAITYQEFTAALEGSKDIEIRARVDGYLDKIYVDEGAYVQKGQLLFQINDRPYQEQLNNARASLAAAKAHLANAEINVSKLTPLVQNNVVSDVQLKAAQATYEAAVASVTQAEAMVSSAQIDLGYTTIKAPVDGYLGRIPFKTGSLVGVAMPEALTVLSEVKEVYAYFSFSEKDFLKFTAQFPGNTIEEKLAQMPPVELILADNSIYPIKGKVETVAGQFDNSTGAISFRATFQNTDGLLRSGNTGRVRIPRSIESALVIPQNATFEIQDKVFVFALSDSNKVASQLITISGKTANYYFVDKGVEAGDRIVFSGMGNLQDGMTIVPQPISADSLLQAKPL